MNNWRDLLKGYKHLTDTQRQQILDSYQKTRSTSLTAEELGLSRAKVAAAVKRAGVPLTLAHNGACYRHQADVERWAQEGVSLSEIARRIGTKHQLVKKFLVEHGIEYKPYRQTMENNTFWRGGRVTDVDGYILVKTPDHPYKDRHGYVREHRLVMEKVLGRYLLPSEVVHHRDNNKQNNAPENLEVFGSNAKHLAETLKGQVPQWSDEGKQRLLNRPSRKPSSQEEEEFQVILASYQRTQSTVLTAQELGKKRQRVSGILKRRGIPLTHKRPTKRPYGVCFRHHDEIVQMASEGVTVAEMARRIGAQRTTLKKYLDSNQIDYRTRRKPAEESQGHNRAQISSH